MKSRTKLEFSVHTPVKRNYLLYTTPLPYWSLISFHLTCIGYKTQRKIGTACDSLPDSLLQSLERDLLQLRKKFLHLENCDKVENYSSNNHLEGYDPEKKVGHNFDFYCHHSTAPVLFCSHIVFPHLTLHQHWLHLQDL